MLEWDSGFAFIMCMNAWIGTLMKVREHWLRFCDCLMGLMFEAWNVLELMRDFWI